MIRYGNERTCKCQCMKSPSGKNILVLCSERENNISFREKNLWQERMNIQMSEHSYA